MLLLICPFFNSRPPPASCLLLQMMGVLEKHPLPPPYYPGIHGRYDAWKQQYPEAKAVGGEPYTPSRPIDGPSIPFLVKDFGVLAENDPRATPGKEYAFAVRRRAWAGMHAAVPQLMASAAQGCWMMDGHSHSVRGRAGGQVDASFDGQSVVVG